MSDTFETVVENPRGAFHQGDGPMTVYQFFAQSVGLLKDSRGRSPREVAHDQRVWLRRRFVAPPGLGEARARLAEKRVVFLDGEPGGGRTTAARMLLHELGEVGAYREIVPEDDDGNPALDPEWIETGDRLLLDLADLGGDRWPEIHQRLPPFAGAARRRKARLAVVLPHRPADPLSTVLQPYAAVIQRPDGRRVLLRCLRCAEGFGRLPPPEEWPGGMVGFLRGEPPMREIGAVAALLERARTAAPSGGFAAWCTVAVEAATDKGEQAANLVRNQREGPARALMMTAALLDGARTESVHAATGLLLETVRHPPDDTHVLERADLMERLKAVTADADGVLRVGFDAVGMAEAVRRHVWNHLPDLREPLCVWAARVLDGVDLSPEHADAFVARLARLGLATANLKELQDLAQQCAELSGRRARRAAALVLETGLRDKRHARAFRRRIYDWARDEEHKPGLEQVLVGVCAEVMADGYPTQAMVRLHHLARASWTTGAARVALLRLVEGDPVLRRRLLARLGAGGTGLRRTVDDALFLEIADPVRFELPEARRDLTDCWARILAEHEGDEGDEWEGPVRRWLAGWAGGRQDGLLDVLVERADPRVRRRLYGLAVVLERAPGSVHGGLADALYARICAAEEAAADGVAARGGEGAMR